MADVAVPPHGHSALADSWANWEQILYSADSCFPPGAHERRRKCCRKDYHRLLNWRCWQPLRPLLPPPLHRRAPFPAIPSARAGYSRKRHAGRAPLHGVGGGDAGAGGADDVDGGDVGRQRPLLPPPPATGPYGVLCVGRDFRSLQPPQPPRRQLAFGPPRLRSCIDPPTRRDSNASPGDRRR